MKEQFGPCDFLDVSWCIFDAVLEELISHWECWIPKMKQEYMPPLDSLQKHWCDCGAGLRVRPQTGKTKGPLLVLARKTSTRGREWWWGGEGGWQRCWTWGGWHVKTNAKVVIMNTSVGPINSWTWLAFGDKRSANEASQIYWFSVAFRIQS